MASHLPRFLTVVTNLTWLPEVTVTRGEPRTIETPLGPLTVELTESGFRYRRPDFEQSEETEPVEKTFLIDDLGESANLSLRALYPDRPIIFKLEDDLSIPPEEDGFFVLTMTVGIGLEIQRTGTVMETLLAEPRKNSFWGPPNEGVLAYQVRSGISTDPLQLAVETDTLTAVVPVWFHNRRPEQDEVNRCLVPIQELDLYRNDEDDLVFEVISLTQFEDFYQEPEPLKRPPKEMKQRLNHYLQAPNKPQSLYERVKQLPRFDSFTSAFINR